MKCRFFTLNLILQLGLASTRLRLGNSAAPSLQKISRAKNPPFHTRIEKYYLHSLKLVMHGGVPSQHRSSRRHTFSPHLTDFFLFEIFLNRADIDLQDDIHFLLT